MIDDQPMDGAQWLARTQPSAQRVLDRWARPPYVAELWAGREWDALRVPARLAMSVLHELRQLGEDIERVPVLEVHAKPGSVYLLTDPGTAATWDVPGDTVILGARESVEMPSPSCPTVGIQHMDRYLMWRYAPDGAGRLVEAGRLADAVTLAQDTGRQARREASARAAMFEHLRHRAGR